jgi:hypothetical protein
MLISNNSATVPQFTITSGSYGTNSNSPVYFTTSGGSNAYTIPSNTGCTGVGVQSPANGLAVSPSYIIKVNDNNYDEIARIESNGTVIVSQYGDYKTSAKVFWKSIQFEGKSLYVKIEDLENNNEALLREVKRLKRQIKDKSCKK